MIDKEKLFKYSIALLSSGIAFSSTDPYELTETLHAVLEEKEFKDSLTDKLIDYNDEIVSIEDVGELETVDIGTTGDNLFFCNDILTKNSIGGPMSADALIGIVQTEEFAELGQYLFIQLKNRYNDVNDPKRFIVGVDKAKMRLYDVEDSAQSTAYNPGKSYEEYDYKPIESSVNKDKFKGIT